MGLLHLHLHDSLVEERLEIGDLIATRGRRPRSPQRAAADGLQPVVAVDDGRVEVGELAQGVEAV